MTNEQECARQSLIEAVKAWREARCFVYGCVGDNHLEECPVELARQDILAAHDKVEHLHAGGS